MMRSQDELLELYERSWRANNLRIAVEPSVTCFRCGNGFSSGDVYTLVREADARPPYRVIGVVIHIDCLTPVDDAGMPPELCHFS